MAVKNDLAVMDGIMLWVGAVILVVIMLPVINGVIAATPVMVSSAWTNQSGTYSPLLNGTQSTVIGTAASSYNLVAIAPIVIAAVVILGVVALLGFRRK